MNWAKLLKDVGIPLAKVAGKFVLKKIITPWVNSEYDETLKKQIRIYKAARDKAEAAGKTNKVKALKEKIKTLELKLARRH